jgi:hypothetical protein
VEVPLEIERNEAVGRWICSNSKPGSQASGRLPWFSAVLLLLAALCATSCGGGSAKASPVIDPPDPTTYTIGGAVSGLAGTGLVLQNNSSNNLSISANGNFTFTTSVDSGGAYSVAVLTQPSNPSQNCMVTNGTGTAKANVSSVQVNCTTVTATTYTIGGMVSGLSGSGLVLQDVSQNNSGDNLTITANGNFTFNTAVSAGGAYSVGVFTQPSNPAQSCAVMNGSGTATASVTSVQVNCTTVVGTTYIIGGTVSGLSGSGLTLQDNGGDNLSIAASGFFTFATPIAGGSSYLVTVKTQPSNPTQMCSVSNASGTANANVSNVTVTCSTTTYTIGGTLSGLTSGKVVLEDNGGDNLSLSANGTFNFATALAAGSNYAVTVSTQPSGQFCAIANDTGIANADVTDIQVTCAVTNGNTITQSFFGADFLLTGLIWPGTDGQGQVATLGGLRLWDDEVKWGQINTSKGVYDWTQLDSWISMAQGQHLDVLYTFGVTPEYDATLPALPVHCVGPTIYGCSAPNDVNADGTGTDADFSDFVTALVTRYKGEIAFYELWDEPDCTCYFDGTDAQLVRMGTDASAIIHSIDPNALVLSPSYHVWTLSNFFDPYIAAGGAATFDIVNFHMRGNGSLNVTPESFLGTYASIEADLVKNKLNNLPLWDSEHGIKADESLPDPDEQAGYVAREVALRAGIGLPRQYVYAWDDTTSPVGLQGNEAGTAWNTVAGWLIGHTVSPCAANGTVYTCSVDSNQMVWDTAQSCSNGTCTYSNYTFPSSYAWQTDLSGTKTALSGKTVQIGYEPILLTSQ